MKITSSLRFHYILWGSGLLCLGPDMRKYGTLYLDTISMTLVRCNIYEENIKDSFFTESA